MSIVNKYKIKDGISLADIEAEIKSKNLPWNDGGEYISKDSIHSTFRVLIQDISVSIAFPEDLSKWDSYDHVLILDESFGQPYYPFYYADEKKDKRFPFVMNVIGLYNKFMNGFDFLERVEK